MNFTEKQKRAIQTSCKNVLVSAAAGSGKTSVLTQRIVRLILEGADIRSMLVMTFTRAAAAEMRQRITRQLRSHAATDKRIAQQAEFASASDISTFHSFCAKVVRENYNLLGCMPNFRILGEYETLVLKNQALRQLFDERYEAEDSDFLRLLSRYTSRANEATLAAQLIRIHNYMMGKHNPFEWVFRPLEQPQPEHISILASEYEAMLIAHLRKAHSLLSDAQAIVAELEQENEPGANSTKPLVEAYHGIVQTLFSQIEREGLASLSQCFANLKFPIIKIADQKSSDLIKPLLQDAKKEIQLVLDDETVPMFENQAAQELEHTRPDAAALACLIQKFHEHYASIKTDRNALDYADLEHFALSALRQNGQLYQQRYRYVFIDEYQDTSQVQEEILSTVCLHNYLFMVGDMKQSIYRFRMADPGIFKQKMQQFRLDEEQDVITMNENFRSHNAVIQTVNFVMDSVMSESLGEINYDENEKLLVNIEGGHSEILLLDMQSLLAQQELTTEEAQAYAISQNIQSLISQRKAAPKDIAILMRSRSNLAPILRQTLEAAGIPCSVNLRGAREVRELDLIVNLLKLIDNTKNDIALLSVMRSFIGSFDENDFAEIRLACLQEDASFYEAVAHYTQTEQNNLAQRLKAFFEQIQHWQLCSLGMALTDFLERLLRTFDFPTYFACLPGGRYKSEAYEAFLELLYELAQTSDNSLYLLLESLREIGKKQEGYIGSTPKESGQNHVQIMTIHQSKGLEFPVVFLADLNRKFNRRDESDPFLLHETYGILPSYIDEQTFEKKTTIERELCKKKVREENLSEELRMLYVAMTRAKEYLFLTGYSKNLEEDKIKWKTMQYENAANMFDWIMSANEKEHTIPVNTVATISKSDACVTELFDLDTCLIDPPNAPALIEISSATRAPAKVSVSAIKKRQTEQMGLGSFLTAQTAEDEQQEIKGARLGTLLHTVMEQMVPDGSITAKQAAQSLLERELIDEIEFDAILKSQSMIDFFFETDIARRLQKSPRVLKEQPFNLKVRAHEIGYEGNDEMLVQGILDLAFLENGTWVLLDYKTDKVTEETVFERALSYRPQLELYARALQDITGVEVSGRYLYFMRLKRTIEV